jgi:hypothetical protein
MRFQFADSWSSVPVVSRVPTGSAGALLSSNSSRRRRSRARRRYRRDPGLPPRTERWLTAHARRGADIALAAQGKLMPPPSGVTRGRPCRAGCIGNIRLVRPGEARYRLRFGGHSRRGLAFHRAGQRRLTFASLASDSEGRPGADHFRLPRTRDRPGRSAKCPPCGHCKIRPWLRRPRPRARRHPRGARRQARHRHAAHRRPTRGRRRARGRFSPLCARSAPTSA